MINKNINLFSFISGKELNSLPSNVRDIMKQSVKRKRIGQQNESLIKINKKKMAKNITSG
jgi:hypothetical protein